MGDREPENRKNHIPYGVLIGLMLLPVAALATLAIRPLFQPGLPQLDQQPVAWTRYSRPHRGFSLDVPDSLGIDEQPDETVMSLDGENIVLISHLSRVQADRCGLWADHRPVADIRPGDVDGKEYVYEHVDLAAGLHVIAHVVVAATTSKCRTSSRSSSGTLDSQAATSIPSTTTIDVPVFGQARCLARQRLQSNPLLQPGGRFG